MSQVGQEQLLSEDQSGTGESVLEQSKLVPVAESIRYRKRAQSAEQKAQELAHELNEARQQTQNLSEQLGVLETEQLLVRKLSAAGANDLETALLVAKARLNSDTDADSVVEQLKSEKAYLFSPAGSSIAGAAAPKTTPAKDRVTSNQSALEKAANRAAVSGSTVDLQEYLKLRRNFL